MAQGSQEVVDSVLWVHRSDITENRAAHAHERRVPLDTPHAPKVGAVAHDEHFVGIDGVASYGYSPIALVRRNGDVGQLEGQLLEQPKTPRHQTVGRLL